MDKAVYALFYSFTDNNSTFMTLFYFIKNNKQQSDLCHGCSYVFTNTVHPDPELLVDHTKDCFDQEFNTMCIGKSEIYVRPGHYLSVASS